MIEKGMPIDCVLHAKTGMDFPEMEAHIAKLDDFLFQERGLHITILQAAHSFEWFMFDVPLQQKRAIDRRLALNQPLHGYGWPGWEPETKALWKCQGRSASRILWS